MVSEAGFFLNCPKVVLTGLAFLLLVAACGGPSPAQQIEQVLDRREQAFAAKDLAAYMSLISQKYADKGKGYQDIREQARQNFEAFEKIELITRKRTVYIENDQAGVVQEYVLSYWLSASGKHSLKDKERLVLQKESDGWKIIKGL